tara:strand:+ start:1427 stop:1660 length:234 start_codon:yes stop_codon:yes gene_type:complete
MSLEKMLFGPVNSDYCLLFYVLMVLVFIGIVLNALAMVYELLNKQKLNKALVSSLVHGIILYFTHRILYSMCISSLE